MHQGSFESWLRGICDNVLRNERRRWLRKEKLRRSFADAEGIVLATKRESGSSVRDELTEQIATALSALPALYQRVLRAKYEEQISVAEIAGRTGGTVKSIESLLSRARAAFRKAYTEINKES